ncbi:MAG TPA: YtxH domain-containing protein [Prolixibacteraceae bacterium]|jgi:gas vesicle protein|nr:YtxH domain-containing protein [Prolixibacteraceae bacterium]
MSSDNGKIVLGVLAGLAAGALLGILFAPDKGSETRKKIINKGEEASDGLKEKLNDLLNDLNQKIDAAKAKARETTSETSNS